MHGHGSLKGGRLAAVLTTLMLVGFGLWPVATADSTWDTTAQFDAGTYSVSDEFRETTSSTCDASMAVDAFALASAHSDEFCEDSTAADTWAWNTCTAGGSSTGVVSSGVLTLDIPSTTGQSIAFRSDFNMTGDVNVSVMLDAGAQVSNSAEWFSLFNENVCKYSDTGTNDGVLYDVFRPGGSPSSASLYAFKVVDGGVVACGSSTDFNTDPMWLKITRVTNTWTWYYSSDGLTYTQDEQCDSTVAGPLWVNSYLDDNGDSGHTTTSYDHWFASADTDVPWRTSGNWTSENFISSPTGVRFIDVNYTSVDANNYITNVELYVDTVLFASFPDDVTSGTTHRYIVTTQNPGTDYQVKVYLVGNGTASPVVTSINTTDWGVATLDFSMVFLWLLVWLGLAICGVVVFFGFGAFGLIAGVFLVNEILVATQNLPLVIIMAGTVVLAFVMSMIGAKKRML